jgi:peroxiredoxin
MAETASTMLPLGTQAPDFQLPDPHGKRTSIGDFQGAPALLVAFICNHCPYVKHIRSRFAALATEYQARGVAVVAISSNDAESFPEDGPEKMAEEIVQAGYTFPYLYDESQEVRCRLYAGLLLVRSRPPAGVPGAVRRQPAEKWPPGNRRRLASGTRRGSGRAPGSERSETERWLQYQVEV